MKGGFSKRGSITGRFGYTGQLWLPEANLYYYKNRMYAAQLGRFVQPDPIGYDGDGPNLYAYTLNDPVNRVDPSGRDCALVTGSRICQTNQDSIAGLFADLGQFYEPPAQSEAKGGGGRGGGSAALMQACANGSESACYLAQDTGTLLQGTTRGYLDAIRYGNANTAATISGIVHDQDIRAAMLRALWISVVERREWGFWIGQEGNDYFAYPMCHGSGTTISGLYARPPGSDILFHAHLFTDRPQGLSTCDAFGNGDVCIASHNNFPILSLSPYLFDWADYRRGH